jgi:methionyl-tRNA formyltransferase
MRIAVIGQAAFGEAVLKALLEKGKEVVGVYAPPDVPGGRGDPLKELALSKGIPLFQPKRMRDPEVYAGYRGLNPDLGVMAFVTDIVPITILNHPPLGTIQYHPSLLPKHRGASAINWAIINGETTTGLTIFWPDAGIDTGPILLQREVTIDPDDSVGSLYFNKLFPLGVASLVEAVEAIERGTAPRIPQDESQATYEPPCREEHALIDWSQPAPTVYNLIRGTNPQPGATTYFGDEKIKVFDSGLRPSPGGVSPGQVIEVTGEGLLVAAAGGAILVKRVQPIGSLKVAASEYAASARLRAGAILGKSFDFQSDV